MLHIPKYGFDVVHSMFHWFVCSTIIDLSSRTDCNQMEVLMFYQQNVAQNIHQTRVHLQLIRVLEKVSPISSKFRLQTLQIFRLIWLLFDTDNFGVTPTSKQSWQHIPYISFLFWIVNNIHKVQSTQQHSCSFIYFVVVPLINSLILLFSFGKLILPVLPMQSFDAFGSFVGEVSIYSSWLCFPHD